MILVLLFCSVFLDLTTVYHPSVTQDRVLFGLFGGGGWGWWWGHSPLFSKLNCPVQTIFMKFGTTVPSTLFYINHSSLTFSAVEQNLKMTNITNNEMLLQLS